MIEKYKAVIFDWDGTLADTCGLILDAHNHVRELYNETPWTMDDFMGRASESAREYYPRIYGDQAEEAQKILYDYVEKHHLTYLKPMGRALDVLDFFKAQKIPMSIVSNKRHNTLHIEVKHFGWVGYFQSIIGAGYAEKDKPSPLSLLTAIKEIEKGLSPEDILYVGDTETDLLTAKNAGCDVAFIQSEKPRPDLIEKYNPKWSFLSVEAFLAAFSSQSPLNKAC